MIEVKDAAEAAHICSTETLVAELKARSVFVYTGRMMELARMQLPDLGHERPLVCVIAESM